MKVVTIWNTYGPYHIARINALVRRVGTANIICFSHCRIQGDYLFFNLKPPNHIVLADKNFADLRFVNSFLAAFRALSVSKPDLVLTCGYERPETLAALIWSKFIGSKVYLMLDNQLDDSPRNRYVEFIKKVYLKFFDGFIYGGSTHKNYLRHLRVSSSKEVNGYNCVDNVAISAGVDLARRQRVSLFPSNDYFLCVARLIPKKNLPRLIHAYARYVQLTLPLRRPWSLVICGDGPEREVLLSLIREYGVASHVSLVGSVNEFDQMINYYAFARALVLASHENEQWGLVVNEAMASGLPVLVSKQCGCSASLVIDGENGFTFDGNSIDELTARLVWMHEHESELPRMGERSRELVAHYSPDNFAAKVLGLYQSQSKG